MPRYFFHIRDGATSIDQIGADFPDDGAARAETVIVLGEILRFSAPDLWSGAGLTVVLECENGRVVAVLETRTSVQPPEDWPWPSPAAP